MPVKPADQKGIVDILNRLYREIADLEEAFSICFGGGDFRVRIEYFHDAVRALVSEGEGAPRLSVELLSYDVSALRYLQSSPFGPFNPGTHHQPVPSAGGGKNIAPPTGPKPDRAARARLGELYQQYAVLFAALFKPFADNDYQERVDQLNDTVAHLAMIEQHVKSGIGSQQATAHVEDPKLKDALTQLLKAGKKREAAQLLKSGSAEADKRIASLSDAHLTYASSQLGIYEEGREVVKKLAAQGMNLAGQFVEASIAQARQDFGRGQR